MARFFYFFFFFFVWVVVWFGLGFYFEIFFFGEVARAGAESRGEGDERDHEA